jgi:hypothetical protein
MLVETERRHGGISSVPSSKYAGVVKLVDTAGFKPAGDVLTVGVRIPPPALLGEHPVAWWQQWP